MKKDMNIGVSIEEESVDFDFLMSLVEEVRETQSTDELIDKFLMLTDLKITAEEDAPSQVVELDEAPRLDIDESLASEELARIYHSQGLYREAKEIYSKLILVYSEKIAYFASQIEKLPPMEDE